MKKELDIVVLSDVHLGTYGCHAGELLQYLKSARDEGFDYVICGHIHCPQLRTARENGKEVIYMNSGD